jgi:GT2 family glycosyltransferase
MSILETAHPIECAQILIVDNGSTDRTAEITRSFPVTYLWEHRKGPSWARNRGIEASRGDILAFTDADCVVSRGWLSALLKEFGDKAVWGVAGEIFAFPARSPAQCYAKMYKSHWQRNALSRSRPYAVTANVAFRRKTFDLIGPFDPYFITGEDQDLSRRFFRAGLKMIYCPEAFVFHRHRTTVWELFKQQTNWASGSVLLNDYSPHDELRGFLRSTWTLTTASLSDKQNGKREIDFTYQLFELIRCLARLVGGLQGLFWKASKSRLK